MRFLPTATPAFSTYLWFFLADAEEEKQALRIRLKLGTILSGLKGHNEDQGMFRKSYSSYLSCKTTLSRAYDFTGTQI